MRHIVDYPRHRPGRFRGRAERLADLAGGRALNGQNVLFCAFSVDRRLTAAAAPHGGAAARRPGVGDRG